MLSFRHIVPTLILAVALALSAGLAAGLAAQPAQARTIAKGLIDTQLEELPTRSAARAGMINEIHTRLGASWVRIIASWPALEPARGSFSPTEFARLDALIGGLHAAGVKIILTTCYMPAWASDSYWWSHPPVGYPHGPQPFDPIATGALKDYGNFGEFLARRYEGRVQALECWNEPNLWPYIFPQRTAADPYFAARVYLRMLKAFHAGVVRSGVAVRIIAGATAPIGLDDAYRTSPQRFARFLQRNGASRYFDIYSHHPYTPGGSVYTAPGQPPDDPAHTITIGNLSTLLRVFPKKPFYLTEYGYNTRPSNAFGGFAVSERTQALYLKAAYRVAAQHGQVKLLVWFDLRDSKPAGAPAQSGAYCGLRRLNGVRKPSWYTFRALAR
jgi:hypothetical protein